MALTLRRLTYWFTILAIFAMSARISVDTDTWWHLRAGEWIVENRAIPQVDSFSYTRVNQSWLYPGWLVEAPMYLVFRAFGPGGLNLVTALLVTLAFFFIWKALSGSVFLRSFGLIFAAAASGVYWSARPHLITLALAAVFLKILEDSRWRDNPATRRRLVWLPIFMIVWVNSHGGFIVGFILWGLYCVDTLIRWRTKQVEWGAFRRLILIGALLAAGTTVNPAGLHIFLYPFSTVGVHALQNYIQEWQSPNFHDLAVQPFAWLLIALIGFLGASTRRIALTDFLLCAVFGYMGLLAGRNIALFALVAPIVITRHLEPIIAELGGRINYHLSDEADPSSRRIILNWGILAAIIMAVVLKTMMIVSLSANERLFEKTLPLAAIRYLHTHDYPGNLFNSYNWGGYLLWALPEYPVFIDGRTDLYDDEIIDQWFQVVQAKPGWQQVLDRWNVNLILLEADSPIVKLLPCEGWSEVYRDKQAILLTRDE